MGEGSDRTQNVRGRSKALHPEILDQEYDADDEDCVMSATDVAIELGVKKSTVTRYLAKGSLTGQKMWFGHQQEWRVSRAALDEFKEVRKAKKEPSDGPTGIGAKARKALQEATDRHISDGTDRMHRISSGDAGPDPRGLAVQAVLAVQASQDKALQVVQRQVEEKQAENVKLLERLEKLEHNHKGELAQLRNRIRELEQELHDAQIGSLLGITQVSVVAGTIGRLLRG